MSVQETYRPVKESLEDKKKLARLLLEYPFDLRGIQSKIDKINSSKVCSGWMIFLNKAGTLAHIMHRDDAEEGTYIRMKIPFGIAGSHPDFMQRWFYNRMIKRYVI